MAGCLNSFARLGHKVVLHTYGAVLGVPPSVSTADASATLPAANILRYRQSGNPSLFSNYFRYKLLSRKDAIWIDTDVYCIRPLDMADPYLFGREDEHHINGAVLRLPLESPLLRNLLNLFEGPTHRPPWVTRRRWAAARILATCEGDRVWSAAPWGATGPAALTWYVRDAGLVPLAQPSSAFYPVHWSEAARLGQSEDPQSFIGPDTRCVHLWRGRKSLAPLALTEGSLLQRIADEGRGGDVAFLPV